MDKFTNAVGIDVSKKTLDVHDHARECYVQVTNSTAGFKELVRWVKKNNGNLTSVLLCFEHTGMYSLPLAIFLSAQNIPYCLVPGLEIKRSMGIKRGKSDQADAKAIALFAYLRKEELKLYRLPSKNLLELKSLLSLREKMVSQRAGYQATKKEMKSLMKITRISPVVLEVQDRIIKELDNQILKVEKQIQQTIEGDESLKKNYDLITTVKGVGLVVGATMIVYTNCFTAFADWRKFACYCGIVPFEYQSGTSIHRKKKVSYFANKRLKSLLSNAACTSLQYNPEMKIYYERRLQEGKSKMSTQNIIRNKIVARVFAVVKRGTPYVDTYRFAA